MKVGRNDPCPCGSGKKYKKCCLTKEKPPVDLLWYRLSSAHDKLIDQLMDYAEERMGPMALMFAIGEFLLWPEEEEDVYDLIDDHMQVFLPWYLFNWLYDPNDGAEANVQIDIMPDKTIAETYLAEYRGQMDDLQVRLIGAAVHSPYSFLEIIACEPGHSLTVKDVLTGEETRVIEETASEMVQIGDILFGSILTVNHVSMLMGVSSIAIRPSFKSHIIALRQHIKKVDGPIAKKELQIHNYDIRDLYLHLHAATIQPPELTNTDGEPLVFHTLHFKIENPQDAFDKLYTLSGENTKPQEILETATYDADNRLTGVTFAWMEEDGSPQTKALGQITIDHDKVYVEVNSAMRAALIQADIQLRLGQSVQYLKTETHGMDEFWPDVDDESEDNWQPREEMEAMTEDPQALAYLQQVIHDHWQGWIDEKIPALGGKTPRQASKTEDGREAIEAILLEARRPLVFDGMMDKFESDPLEAVRHKLGLHKPLKKKGGPHDTQKQQQAYKTIEKIIVDGAGPHMDSRLMDLTLQLCRRLAAGDEFSLDRGKPENWAAAITFVIADLNFLFDPESEQYISREALCAAFDVKPRTASDKARHIKNECEIEFADPRFTLPEIADRFTFMQTPEGFLLPKNMADDFLEHRGFRGSGRPKLHAVPPRKSEKKKTDEKKPTQTTRQLGLFNDEE